MAPRAPGLAAKRRGVADARARRHLGSARAGAAEGGLLHTQANASGRMEMMRWRATSTANGYFTDQALVSAGKVIAGGRALSVG